LLLLASAASPQVLVLALFVQVIAMAIGSTDRSGDISGSGGDGSSNHNPVDKDIAGAQAQHFGHYHFDASLGDSGSSVL
jgi:hypothetical protein